MNEFLCRHCGYSFHKTLTLKERIDKITPKFCGQKCAQEYTIIKLSKSKNKRGGVPQSSKIEKSFGELVKSFFPDLKSQHKLKNYDHHYDFYCPSLNLIIEFNGIYWHTMKKNTIKDKKHLLEATRQNVGLSVVTDKEWKVFMDSVGKPDKKKLLKLFQAGLQNNV